MSEGCVWKSLGSMPSKRKHSRSNELPIKKIGKMLQSEDKTKNLGEIDLDQHMAKDKLEVSPSTKGYSLSKQGNDILIVKSSSSEIEPVTDCTLEVHQKAYEDKVNKEQEDKEPTVVLKNEDFCLDPSKGSKSLIHVNLLTMESSKFSNNKAQNVNLNVVNCRVNATKDICNENCNLGGISSNSEIKTQQKKTDEGSRRQKNLIRNSKENPKFKISNAFQHVKTKSLYVGGKSKTFKLSTYIAATSNKKQFISNCKRVGSVASRREQALARLKCVKHPIEKGPEALKLKTHPSKKDRVSSKITKRIGDRKGISIISKHNIDAKKVGVLERKELPNTKEIIFVGLEKNIENYIQKHQDCDEVHPSASGTPLHSGLDESSEEKSQSCKENVDTLDKTVISSLSGDVNSISCLEKSKSACVHDKKSRHREVYSIDNLKNLLEQANALKDDSLVVIPSVSLTLEVVFAAVNCGLFSDNYIYIWTQKVLHNRKKKECSKICHAQFRWLETLFEYITMLDENNNWRSILKSTLYCPPKCSELCLLFEAKDFFEKDVLCFYKSLTSKKDPSLKQLTVHRDCKGMENQCESQEVQCKPEVSRKALDNNNSSPYHLPTLPDNSMVQFCFEGAVDVANASSHLNVEKYKEEGSQTGLSLCKDDELTEVRSCDSVIRSTGEEESKLQYSSCKTEDFIKALSSVCQFIRKDIVPTASRKGHLTKVSYKSRESATYVKRLDCILTLLLNIVTHGTPVVKEFQNTLQEFYKDLKKFESSADLCKSELQKCRMEVKTKMIHNQELNKAIKDANRKVDSRERRLKGLEEELKNFKKNIVKDGHCGRGETFPFPSRSKCQNELKRESTDADRGKEKFSVPFVKYHRISIRGNDAENPNCPKMQEVQNGNQIILSTNDSTPKVTQMGSVMPTDFHLTSHIPPNVDVSSLIPQDVHVTTINSVRAHMISPGPLDPPVTSPMLPDSCVTSPIPLNSCLTSPLPLDISQASHVHKDNSVTSPVTQIVHRTSVMLKDTDLTSFLPPHVRRPPSVCAEGCFPSSVPQSHFFGSLMSQDAIMSIPNSMTTQGMSVLVNTHSSSSMPSDVCMVSSVHHDNSSSFVSSFAKSTTVRTPVIDSPPPTLPDISMVSPSPQSSYQVSQLNSPNTELIAVVNYQTKLLAQNKNAAKLQDLLVKEMCQNLKVSQDKINDQSAKLKESQEKIKELEIMLEQEEFRTGSLQRRLEESLNKQESNDTCSKGLHDKNISDPLSEESFVGNERDDITSLDVKDSSERLKELEDRLVLCSNIISNKSKNIQQLERDVSFYSKKVTDLEDGNEKLSGILESLQEEIKSKEVRIRNLQKEFECKEVRIRHLESMPALKTLQDKELEISNLNSKITCLHKETSERDASIGQLEQEALHFAYTIVQQFKLLRELQETMNTAERSPLGKCDTVETSSSVKCNTAKASSLVKCNISEDSPLVKCNSVEASPMTKRELESYNVVDNGCYIVTEDESKFHTRCKKLFNCCPDMIALLSERKNEMPKLISVLRELDLRFREKLINEKVYTIDVDVEILVTDVTLLIFSCQETDEMLQRFIQQCMNERTSKESLTEKEVPNMLSDCVENCKVHVDSTVMDNISSFPNIMPLSKGSQKGSSNLSLKGRNRSHSNDAKMIVRSRGDGLSCKSNSCQVDCVDKNALSDACCNDEVQDIHKNMYSWSQITKKVQDQECFQAPNILPECSKDENRLGKKDTKSVFVSVNEARPSAELWQSSCGVLLKTLQKDERYKIKSQQNSVMTQKTLDENFHGHTSKYFKGKSQFLGHKQKNQTLRGKIRGVASKEAIDLCSFSDQNQCWVSERFEKKRQRECYGRPKNVEKSKSHFPINNNEAENQGVLCNERNFKEKFTGIEEGCCNIASIPESMKMNFDDASLREDTSLHSRPLLKKGSSDKQEHEVTKKIKLVHESVVKDFSKVEFQELSSLSQCSVAKTTIKEPALVNESESVTVEPTNESHVLGDWAKECTEEKGHRKHKDEKSASGTRDESDITINFVCEKKPSEERQENKHRGSRRMGESKRKDGGLGKRVVDQTKTECISIQQSVKNSCKEDDRYRESSTIEILDRMKRKGLEIEGKKDAGLICCQRERTLVRNVIVARLWKKNHTLEIENAELKENLKCLESEHNQVAVLLQERNFVLNEAIKERNEISDLKEKANKLCKDKEIENKKSLEQLKFLELHNNVLKSKLSEKENYIRKIEADIRNKDVAIKEQGNYIGELLRETAAKEKLLSSMESEIKCQKRLIKRNEVTGKLDAEGQRNEKFRSSVTQTTEIKESIPTIKKYIIEIYKELALVNKTKSKKCLNSLANPTSYYGAKDCEDLLKEKTELENIIQKVMEKVCHFKEKVFGKNEWKELISLSLTDQNLSSMIDEATNALKHPEQIVEDKTETGNIMEQKGEKSRQVMQKETSASKEREVQTSKVNDIIGDSSWDCYELHNEQKVPGAHDKLQGKNSSLRIDNTTKCNSAADCKIHLVEIDRYKNILSEKENTIGELMKKLEDMESLRENTSSVIRMQKPEGKVETGHVIALSESETDALWKSGNEKQSCVLAIGDVEGNNAEENRQEKQELSLREEEIGCQVDSLPEKPFDCLSSVSVIKKESDEFQKEAVVDTSRVNFGSSTPFWKEDERKTVELQKLCDSLCFENSELQRSVKSLKVEKKELERYVGVLISEKELLQKSIDVSDLEKVTLRKSLDKEIAGKEGLQRTVVSLNTEKEKLQDTVNSWISKNEILKESLDSIQSQQEALSQSKEQLSIDRQHLKNSVESLVIEKEDLQKTVRSLNTEKETITSKWNKAEMERSSIQNKLQETENSLEIERERLKESLESNQNLLENINSKEVLINDYVCHIDQYKKNIMEKEVVINDLKKNAEEKHISLEKDLEIFQDQNQVFKEIIESLKNERDTLNSRLKTLEMELGDGEEMHHYVGQSSSISEIRKWNSLNVERPENNDLNSVVIEKQKVDHGNVREVVIKNRQEYEQSLELQARLLSQIEDLKLDKKELQKAIGIQESQYLSVEREKELLLSEMKEREKGYNWCLKQKEVTWENELYIQEIQFRKVKEFNSALIDQVNSLHQFRSVIRQLLNIKSSLKLSSIPVSEDIEHVRQLCCIRTHLENRVETLKSSLHREEVKKESLEELLREEQAKKEMANKVLHEREAEIVAMTETLKREQMNNITLEKKLQEEKQKNETTDLLLREEKSKCGKAKKGMHDLEMTLRVQEKSVFEAHSKVEAAEATAQEESMKCEHLRHMLEEEQRNIECMSHTLEKERSEYLRLLEEFNQTKGEAYQLQSGTVIRENKGCQTSNSLDSIYQEEIKRVRYDWDLERMSSHYFCKSLINEHRDSKAKLESLLCNLKTVLDKQAEKKNQLEEVLAVMSEASPHESSSDLNEQA